MPLGTDAGRENLIGTDPLLSTLQILRTRSLAQRVVDAPGGGLLRTRVEPPADPAVFRGLQVDSSIDAGRVALTFDDGGVRATSEGRSVAARYGDVLVVGPVRLTVPARPSVASTELTLVARAVAAGRVQRAITARPRQGTDVVDVSFDAAAPELAVGAVNLVADVYRATILDHERGRLRERARFVERRLQQTTVALAAAQEALTAFRVRQRAFSTRDDMAAARSGYVLADQRRREMSAERGLVGRLPGARDGCAGRGARRGDPVSWRRPWAPGRSPIRRSRTSIGS